MRWMFSCVVTSHKAKIILALFTAVLLVGCGGGGNRTPTQTPLVIIVTGDTPDGNESPDGTVSDNHVECYNITLKETDEPTCKKCWDKGYSTQLHGYHISADFVGDKSYDELPTTHKNYCTCELGKKMKAEETNESLEEKIRQFWIDNPGITSREDVRGIVKITKQHFQEHPEELGLCGDLHPCP